MGFRFRKSIKAGPVRINLSKSGVGYSVGGKGFRYTKKAGGGTRTTVSIPGTGISHVSETANKKTTASTVASRPAPTAPKGNGNKPPKNKNAIWGTIFLICGILFSGSLPLIALISYILAIVFLCKWTKQAKKAKQNKDATAQTQKVEEQAAAIVQALHEASIDEIYENNPEK